ncbi:MAG: uroporphyrinogen decarboxylase [Chloroflexi bacterium]|nr:uroporphyrinogen decarboxylase [Chloroflexota bacterium]
MMKHRERINAALRGELVDRVPVALWRHFPGDDTHADKLAARVVEFQKKYDFDFVKITPASGFRGEMYGATYVDGKNREGTRAYVTLPVQALNDWEKIVPLDAANPVFIREFTATKLVRQQIGVDTHILQTIFSPLSTAQNLAKERVWEDLRQNPEVLHRALRAITETTIRFAIANLRAGADAIFFATQSATAKSLSREEFRAFGAAYDLQVLEAIRAVKPDFVFLHIHGFDIYFDELMNYPVDVLNWHDRRTAPSLKDAREILRAAQINKTIAGGIDEYTVLGGTSRDDVLAQARDAIAQAGERGFILAAGCVTLVDTPEENIKAVVAAAR